MGQHKGQTSVSSLLCEHNIQTLKRGVTWAWRVSRRSSGPRSRAAEVNAATNDQGATLAQAPAAEEVSENQRPMHDAGNAGLHDPLQLGAPDDAQAPEADEPAGHGAEPIPVQKEPQAKRFFFRVREPDCVHCEAPTESAEDVVEMRNEEALHLLRMVLVEEDLLALGHANLVVRSMEVVAGLAIRQEEE